ncbi:MAG TPA: alpha/beta hydrolase [Burkholderiales bacterium]|nr:alpha/beta hydrolase [Burkholderiales bacterium]
MSRRAPHPQVAQLLYRAARSPLPPYHAVQPFVARRIYRDTRAALSPKPEEVSEARLILAGGVAVRAYRPAGEAKDAVLPALVYYHGGGWTIGDLDTHDALCRQLANGARCAVFSVDYRLAPEYPFPAAVEDCIAATRDLCSSASSLRIDPERVAVGGDSAGGNLAAVVCLHARDHGGPRLAFQLLIYPASDQRCGFPSHEENAEGYLLTRESIAFFRGAYLPRREDWTDWRASPLLAASHRDLPPAYVVTAGFDPLRDEGRAYAERLKAAGVAVALREYDDMVHGFILFGGVLDTANEAVHDCCAALRGALGQVNR